MGLQVTSTHYHLHLPWPSRTSDSKDIIVVAQWLLVLASSLAPFLGRKLQGPRHPK